MKRCPKCGQSYADQDLNFCLNDGELLAHSPEPIRSPHFTDEPPPTRFADDSPPTLVMDSPRLTNPTGWGGPSAAVPYQGPQSVYQPQQQYGVQNFARGADQTLPIVSLCLGVASFVFVCCYGGLWLGIPAMVVGFIGLRNADSDPGRYGGRGLAIAGMVIGIVTLILSLVLLFFGVLGQIT